MARITCPDCGHDWKRLPKPSRGQAIRCPQCGKTIGYMSKPWKPNKLQKLIVTKAVNEYVR